MVVISCRSSSAVNWRPSSNVGKAPFSLEDHSRRLGGDLRNGLRRLKRREEGEEESIRQARWKGGDVWVLSGRSMLAPVVKRLGGVEWGFTSGCHAVRPPPCTITP
jgi:hypothetical protein